MQREPSLIISAVTAFLVAVFGLAAAFGFGLSGEQQKAILGTVGPCVTLFFLVGFLIRQTVYSPKSAQKIRQGAAPAAADEALPSAGAVNYETIRQ